jgi:DNA-binding response OmpR family regulator
MIKEALYAMAAKKNGKSRILIVGDDKDTLETAGGFLKARGYGIAQAHSDKEAFKEVKTARPNLILLDVMTPKMDGFQLCRTLKAEPKSRSIPIIFLMAKDDAYGRIEGQRCGGDDYMTKPLDPDMLEVRINAQLKKLSKNELVMRIEDILDIPEPKGFLEKLDLDELSTLLKHIEVKLNRK